MKIIDYLVQKKVVRWCGKVDWVSIEMTDDPEVWKRRHPEIDMATIKFTKRERATPEPEEFQLQNWNRG